MTEGGVSGVKGTLGGWMFGRVTVVLDVVMAAIMAILLVAVSCQVFARYVLRFSFAWSEELPVLLFVWLAYLGGAGALVQGRHLSVLFIRDALPHPAQRALRVIGGIVVAVFLLWVVVLGWQTALGMNQVRFSAIPLSRFWLFLAVPVGSLCMIPFVIRGMLFPETVVEESPAPGSPQQSIRG